MDIRDALNILNESVELKESTGQECLIEEVAPGVWYYVLEDRFDAEDGHSAWDWRENAQCFGPFNSEEDAHEHLRMNHANPGGYNVSPFNGTGPDEVMQKLVADAPRNMKWTKNPFENFRQWGKPV